VVVDSVPAGLMVVVVVSVEVVAVGLAAGVTVSVFCSQAATNAAPARMQMYFFIRLCLRNPYIG
jgi:flagellar biosynthesis protein FliQ